jgi:sporulation protein YlmC with PRC-barrel domain
MADRAKRSKKTVSRGMRDEAGVGPNPRDARRLTSMKDLDDYKVAEGEPDIRGWNVYTATGRELGDVEDLLVDVDLGEVVMLDIDLKRNDRHTLAPIKAAWIDRDNRRVVLNTTMFDADEAIPALGRRNEPVESESVRQFNERYERAYGADGWDRDRDITIRRANDDLVISRSDDLRAKGLQPERRRYVRYGPSRDRIADDLEVRRRIADEADRVPLAPTERMSPAETERLRQQSGDVTMDARDTLVTPPPPPTDERR